MDSTQNPNEKVAERPEITKEEWFKWKTATFGDAYIIWHDGLELSGVISLTGSEREKALVMLRRGIDFSDEDCATALAAMQDHDSISDLRQALANSKGESKVSFALAIHRLEPDEALAEHLIDVLKNGSYWGEKMPAAIGLLHFSGEASERALLEAVEHEGAFLVRYHAVNSLVGRWKVRTDDPRRKDIGRLIGRPNGAVDRNEVVTEEFQRNLTEARVQLESLRDEYVSGEKA